MSSKKPFSFFWIGFSILAAMLVRFTLIGVFKIPTSTMLPTLLNGDLVVSNKLAYRSGHSPQIGDIVVFSRPEALGLIYIKRVLATEGQKLQIKNGQLFINQSPCEKNLLEDLENFQIFEEICDKKSYKILLSKNKPLKASDLPEIELKAGEIFVMGDNRDISEDSREWGPIKAENIQGQVRMVWFSYSTTQDSISKENGFRFSRFLTKIQ